MGSFASLAIDARRVVAADTRSAAGEASLQQSIDLNRFLAGVERSAFRIAEMSVRDRDDALDIVQGAMLRLARSYGRLQAQAAAAPGSSTSPASCSATNWSYGLSSLKERIT